MRTRYNNNRSPDQRQLPSPNRLKSLQCSSVYQQLQESNEVSWLGQLVTGLDKQSLNRSNLFQENYFDRLQANHPQHKAYSYNPSPVHNAQALQTRPLGPNQNNIRIQQNQIKFRRTSPYEPLNRAICSASTPKKQPLAVHSSNLSYTDAFQRRRTKGTLLQASFRKKSPQSLNFTQHSSISLNNVSIGKIVKNKEKINQKQNCYPPKNTTSNYFYSQQLPHNQCYNLQLQRQKAPFVPLRRPQMDQQQRKLHEMEERLDQVIRRSAGKIKSSNQATHSKYWIDNSQMKKKITYRNEANGNYVDTENQRRKSSMGSVTQSTDTFPKSKSYDVQNTTDSQRYHQAAPPQKKGNANIVSKSDRKEDAQQWKRVYRNSDKKQVGENLNGVEKSYTYNNIKGRQKISRLLPKLEDIIPEQSSEELSSNCSARWIPHFRRIFCILDQNELGILDKSNCQGERLNEELKYILGSILSKIKYQNRTYNSQRFIAECEQIIGGLDYMEIKQILQKIVLNPFELDTKRSFYSSHQDPYQTRRSNTNSQVTRKFEIYDQQLQDKRSQRFQKDEPKISSRSSQTTLKRQPYLEQPSLILSVRQIISPLNPEAEKTNQNDGNQAPFSRRYPLQKAQSKSITKSAYIQQPESIFELETQQQQAVKQMKRSIVDVSPQFSKRFTERSPIIKKSILTGTQVTVGANLSESDRILSLNRKLESYIRNLPIEKVEQATVKLNFNELQKNLKG